MARLRRALVPLIAAWFLCQAGTTAAVWIPAFDDCACPHSEGAVCPMHQGSASRSKTCSMRGVDYSAASLTIASLLTAAAPVSTIATTVAIETSALALPRDRSAATLRPIPPDPPPPRA